MFLSRACSGEGRMAKAHAQGMHTPLFPSLYHDTVEWPDEG